MKLRTSKNNLVEEVPFQHKQNWQSLKSIWQLEYAVLDVFMCFCFLSLILMQPKTENLWTTKYPRQKILDPRNTPEKKIWTHEITRRKTFGPRKTLEKNFGFTKYPLEKNLDPRNNQEKNFWTHERPSRFTKYPLEKNFLPTKYPREKTLDLQNTL